MKHAVWKRDFKLAHPTNGSDIYGHLPEIRVHRGPVFKPGPIHLKYGEHFGKNRGFGFQHLWKAHFPSVEDHQEALMLVCNRVADCLTGIITVFYERPDTLETARFRVGNLILQSYNSSGHHYSVVSGGYARVAHGTQIARINPNEKGP